MLTQVLLDHGEKKIITNTVQDVEPYLEWNSFLRTLDQPSDWGRHIAEIPNVILVKWVNEEHARGNIGLRLYTKEMDELVRRKLRDPDWAYLRTDKKNPALGWAAR